MTEESFQQCRKVMQKINYVRGLITKAKANVGKWTKMESFYRSELKEAQADGAKKMLDIHVKKLQDLKTKFEMMKFPDNNIVAKIISKVQCECCGSLIEQGNTFCAECLQDDYD